ncbi:biotin/lipoyl-binding protein [Undibacterium sp. SXout7W]|uniref:HlyD family efflux transporter periplasmic adaptor subunit n=1 Tax=Undibacterium sp. SXout7W TaxID=3413049 RepID=UPI003BF0923D
MSFKISFPALGRVVVTLAMSGVAILAGLYLWKHYEIEPWTRDGRIKANVVQIAPDVTGQVTALYVHDNQRVSVNQVLFEIDRSRFELALRQAEAAEQAQRTALAQTLKEARRNSELHDLVSQEIREQGDARVEQMRAGLAQAVVARDLARLNLARTKVVSAINGVVTNLDLQAGTYVTAGHPVMALVDRDSFYAEGYFEETKLPNIHIGDHVSVSLMGDTHLLNGQVDSVAEGIVDRDRTTGSNLLSSVTPNFNWVRLAQRIPVRIRLDRIPDNVRLVAGQTATVAVQSRLTTERSVQ